MSYTKLKNADIFCGSFGRGYGLNGAVNLSFFKETVCQAMTQCPILRASGLGVPDRRLGSDVTIGAFRFSGVCIDCIEIKGSISVHIHRNYSLNSHCRFYGKVSSPEFQMLYSFVQAE